MPAEYVQQTSGSKLVIQIGDGATPEQFKTLCTVNAARGVTFNKGLVDEQTIDCNDPDAAAWIVREVDNKSVEFNGGGKHHRADSKRVWGLYQSDDSVNCKIILDDPEPANVVTFTGKFHLESFSLQGERKGKIDSEMAWKSDGPVTAAFGANIV